METINQCYLCKSSTKLLWKLWEENSAVKLDGDHNWLTGYSWAALRTNFNVGRLMFDAGLSSNKCSDYIFLTHGHSDHSASLYFHTLSENHQIIYVPYEIKELTDSLLINTFRLSNYNVPFDEAEASYEVIGVKPGDVLNIKHNGRNHNVIVYDNHHSVPCRSYGIQEEKKELKEEFKIFIKENRARELGELR